MDAQNRTKLMTAIALLMLAVFLLFRMCRQQNSAPTTAAEHVAEVPFAPVDTQGTSHGRASSAVGRSKDPAVSLSAPILDPTLRLDLLNTSEGTKYARARNIFRAAEDDQPTRPPIDTAAQNAPPDPPQYSSINIKSFGVAGIPASPA
jgi:hypothetical protein